MEVSSGVLFAAVGFITLLSQKSSSGVSREKKQRFQSSPMSGGEPATADRSSIRPRFRAAPQNVTVNPGEKAVLRCRVENLGSKTVTWRRFGDVHPLTIGQSTFVADPRVVVDFVRRMGEWNLVINDVRPMDDGIYQCQINAKDDHHNYHTVYLQVKAIQVRGSRIVVRGDPVQLVCVATGRSDPPRTVEWSKNGRSVESNAGGGLVVTKKVEAWTLVSVLVIRRSRLGDAGVYVCRSSCEEEAAVEVTVLNNGASLAERITRSGVASISTGHDLQLAVHSSLLQCLLLTAFAIFLSRNRQHNVITFS